MYKRQENDLPGIALKDEQRQLQNIIGIAQDNLDRAKESVKKLTDDLEDLRDVYEAQEKEGLALWNNATAVSYTHLDVYKRQGLSSIEMNMVCGERSSCGEKTDRF